MLAYGREPSEEEIKLGIDYLHAEPMREYEENKNKRLPRAAGAADEAVAATDAPPADTAQDGNRRRGAERPAPMERPRRCRWAWA